MGVRRCSFSEAGVNAAERRWINTNAHKATNGGSLPRYSSSDIPPTLFSIVFFVLFSDVGRGDKRPAGASLTELPSEEGEEDCVEPVWNPLKMVTATKVRGLVGVGAVIQHHFCAGLEDF